MLSRSTPTGALIALAAFFVLTIASPSVAVGKEVKSAKGSALLPAKGKLLAGVSDTG